MILLYIVLLVDPHRVNSRINLSSNVVRVLGVIHQNRVKKKIYKYLGHILKLLMRFEASDHFYHVHDHSDLWPVISDWRDYEVNFFVLKRMNTSIFFLFFWGGTRDLVLHVGDRYTNNARWSSPLVRLFVENRTRKKKEKKSQTIQTWISKSNGKIKFSPKKKKFRFYYWIFSSGATYFIASVLPVIIGGS